MGHGLLSQVAAKLQPRLACLDLDMSLVDSSGLYISLEIQTCRHFGFDDAKAVIDTHRRLQPYSGHEIMQGLFALVTGGQEESAQPICFEDFDRHFMDLVRKLEHGRTELEVKPALIGGALELVSALEHLQVEYRVTTGSKPGMASILLEHSGLAHKFPRERRICSGDLPTQKSDQLYWQVVRGDIPAGNCIGFEDNPTCAEWMLEAGFGAVFVRPGQDYPNLSEMQRRFNGRLHIVTEWMELL